MVRIGRCFHSNTFLEAQNYLSNISATPALRSWCRGTSTCLSETNQVEEKQGGDTVLRSAVLARYSQIMWAIQV
jgi:hypothetical protein